MNLSSLCTVFLIVFFSNFAHTLVQRPNVTTLTRSTNTDREFTPALNNNLGNILSVASNLDASEFYYCTDTLIRKVGKDGIIRNIAGTGSAGYNSDHNGDALKAMLNNPFNLFLDDSNGDLYFTDRDNHLIRKIDVNGKIFDIAGIPQTSGNLDLSLNNSTFNYPRQLLVYGPNKDIYVAENNGVRLISQVKSQVSTLLLSGSNQGRGIAINPTNGDIYFSTFWNVFKISNGTVTLMDLLFKDNIANEAYSFIRIECISFKDSTQELFISDINNQRVRVLNVTSNEVSTLVGGNSEESFEAKYQPQYGKRVNLGWNQIQYLPLMDQLLISDYTYRVIRKVEIQKQAWTTVIAGSGDSSTISGTTYEKSFVRGNSVSYSLTQDAFVMASNQQVIRFKDGLTSFMFNINLSSSKTQIEYADNKDNFYLALGLKLYKYLSNQTIISMIPDYYGVDNVPYNQAISNTEYIDIKFNKKTSDIYLLSKDRIRKISQDGIISTVHLIIDSSGKSIYQEPRSIAVDSNSTLYFSDASYIYIVETLEKSKKIIDASFSLFGLTFNELDKQLYFLDSHQVRAYNFTSETVSILSGSSLGYQDGPIQSALFESPNGMDINPENGDIFISDTNNCVIRMISQGVVSTIAGEHKACYQQNGPLLNGSAFNYPQHLSYYRGLLFVISDNQIIEVSLSDNTVEKKTTINYSSKIYGDGKELSASNTFGKVVAARMSPIDGNLYFLDNKRVRMVDWDVKTVFTIMGQVIGNVHYSKTHFEVNKFSVNYKGELIFYDSNYSNVRKIDLNGMVSTIAGYGVDNYYDNNTRTEYNIIDFYGLTTCPNDDSVYLLMDGGIFKLTPDRRLIKQLDISEISVNHIKCTKFGTIFIVGNKQVYRYYESSNSLKLVAGNSESSGDSQDGFVSDATFSNVVGLSVNPLTNSIIIVEDGSGNGKTVRRIGCIEGYEMQDDFQTCLPLCFNKSDNTSACNGNGICYEVNSCSCREGWFGIECETPICFGLNGTVACSGKGNCSAANNCTCNSGYYGSKCEIFDCFNIPNNDPNVCGGRGNCYSPNNCTCSSGYIGKQCETPVCFGLIENNACGGALQGTCVSSNNCTCINGWSGSQCSTAPKVSLSQRLGNSEMVTHSTWLLIIIIALLALIRFE